MGVSGHAQVTFTGAEAYRTHCMGADAETFHIRLPRGIAKHVHHDSRRLSQWKMAIPEKVA